MEPEIHNPIHKFPPPLPILSQLDPVQAPIKHFPKFHINIILPSTPGSSQCSLSRSFSYRNSAHTSPLPHTYCLSPQSHSSQFDHPDNIERRSQWARGLTRRSSAARLLRLWVRIPLGAWIFVCCKCCVLSGRGLCDGLITRPEESYRLWRVFVCDQETSNTRRLKPSTGLWKYTRNGL